jgi:Zn-dependent peptidase ImmA (M78 family)
VASSKKKWPLLPEATVAPGGGVKVTIVPEESIKGFMGMYTTQDRVIRIAANMSPEVSWLTYFHEVVEAHIHDSGLHNLIVTKKQKAMKEAVCDAVALGMLAQFKHDRGL